METLENSLMADIASAADEASIEAVRVAALGKKGSVSEMLKTLGAMSAEERQAVNWTPAFRDNAVANYKSSSHILSMLRGM